MEKHYLVLNGDIIGSRELAEDARKESMNKLQQVCNVLNSRFSGAISGDFYIAGRDSIQGVLRNAEKLLEVLNKTDFRFAAEGDKTTVSVNGEDVTEQIRSSKVTANARHIASAVKIRDKLVQMQRQFAADEEKIVTEGRDQGTVAFPDADVKFFLTADIAERAKRRHKELLAKGQRADLEQIQAAIEKRDKSDEDRTVGPLKPADDAIVVDTTNLDVDEVVKKLLDYVKKNS